MPGFGRDFKYTAVVYDAGVRSTGELTFTAPEASTWNTCRPRGVNRRHRVRSMHVNIVGQSSEIYFGYFGVLYVRQPDPRTIRQQPCSSLFRLEPYLSLSTFTRQTLTAPYSSGITWHMNREWKSIQAQLTKNWSKIQKYMPADTNNTGDNRRMFYEAVLLHVYGNISARQSLNDIFGLKKYAATPKPKSKAKSKAPTPKRVRLPTYPERSELYHRMAKVYPGKKGKEAPLLAMWRRHLKLERKEIPIWLKAFSRHRYRQQPKGLTGARPGQLLITPWFVAMEDELNRQYRRT